MKGLALVMHKNREGPAVFEMLRKALELARREQRVTEERNIRILIAQMHVVKVGSWNLGPPSPAFYLRSCLVYICARGRTILLCNMRALWWLAGRPCGGVEGIQSTY